MKKKNAMRIRVAPCSFLTAGELVSKSRSIKRNEMSTNMASKFVKKNFEQLRESLPVSKHLSNEYKTLPFCTWYKREKYEVCWSFNQFVRSSRELLSWGKTQLVTSRICSLWRCLWRNSNENENSAKSGISQDVTEITNISKNIFEVGHKSSKRFTLLEFRTRLWASDTHAHVVVSKLYDVTNMQTEKTRAHFSRVSFGEILWKFVYFMI